MTKSSLYAFAFIVLSGSLLIYSGQSQAGPTKWEDLGGGRARMVSVYDPVANLVEGIIDVELMPGWVTYWRNPGESGIPPDFNFSNSSGVTVEQPEFPVPTAKTGSGITSIVYMDHVAFPFKATPVISPLSGNLKLELLMGVCDVICIPAIASFSQDLTKLNQSDVISNAMINTAKEKIPTALGDDQSGSELQILGSRLISKSALLIKVKLPATAQKAELFAEGKDDWFFYPANLIKREGEIAEFELELDDLPKDADLLTTPLRLTLSAGGMGIERTIIAGK